jgi:hypothetical protein
MDDFDADDGVEYDDNYNVISPEPEPRPLNRNSKRRLWIKQVRAATKANRRNWQLGSLGLAAENKTLRSKYGEVVKMLRTLDRRRQA